MASNLGERQPLRVVVGGGDEGWRRKKNQNGKNVGLRQYDAAPASGGDDDDDDGEMGGVLAAVGGRRWWSLPRFSSTRGGVISMVVAAACVAAVVATAAVRANLDHHGASSPGAAASTSSRVTGMSTSAQLGQAPADGSITFTVHLCGLNGDVWRDHVPWEVCRVKLVGCPTKDVANPDCAHW